MNINQGFQFTTVPFRIHVRFNLVFMKQVNQMTMGMSDELSLLFKTLILIKQEAKTFVCEQDNAFKDTFIQFHFPI